MSFQIDLTGKRFGRWTALKFIGQPYARWECRCDCGALGKIGSQNLRLGDSTQCKACATRSRFAKINGRLIGTKFGRWTVLSIVAKYSHVKCECGNVRKVTTNSLRMGNSTQCLDCGLSPKLPFGEAAFRQVGNQYKSGARGRKYSWGLSDDEARLLFSQACAYCGKLPTEDPIVCKKAATEGTGDFAYNGIDRRDNSIGYTPDNSISCCIVCNRAKHAMSLDMFITWITRLKAHDPAIREIAVLVEGK